MQYEVVVKVDSEESEAQVPNESKITFSIDQKLNKWYADPYSQTACACIYIVSQKLRKGNEAAFTPRLVSIGPIHHDLVQLQGMEAYKLRFLHKFLTRFGIGLDSFVKVVAKEESFVRSCYEGHTVELSSDQFIEKILLDGIFIVELFLENHFFRLRDGNEIVFESRSMYNDLLHDMLLENQLPLSIINKLLEFADISLFLDGGIKLNIYDLAHKFFKNVGITHKVPLTEHCRSARHFVEFLLFLHAPEKVRSIEQHDPTSPAGIVEYTRSATELHEAGVRFRSAEGNSLFEVMFEKGVLTIFKFIVDETSETFFRNLVAFEQSGYFWYYSKNIRSYVILMDGFINTPDDVDLLVHYGIIENKLGESAKVAELFNNLYKEVLTEPTDFYFTQVCHELNKYSRDTFHRLKARWFNWGVMLKRQYFSNPWSIISVFAATVLLILTIIQTVCSILQVPS